MDREAFAAIYREHVGRVTGFAARRLSSSGDVADLVAATFVVALERSDPYDPSPGDPGAWLVGIAGPRGRRHGRRGGPRTRRTGSPDAAVPPAGRQPPRGRAMPVIGFERRRSRSGPVFSAGCGGQRKYVSLD
ncbi:MAG: sigma-70 family RNA polymerase sigma factor [Acidimicrobiia bacterium]|nr:sigma-70 family RNA polymerase sigma factor [Acidimicrobiia bacterium]